MNVDAEYSFVSASPDENSQGYGIEIAWTDTSMLRRHVRLFVGWHIPTHQQIPLLGFSIEPALEDVRPIMPEALTVVDGWIEVGDLRATVAGPGARGHRIHFFDSIEPQLANELMSRMFGGDIPTIGMQTQADAEVQVFRIATPLPDSVATEVLRAMEDLKGKGVLTRGQG